MFTIAVLIKVHLDLWPCLTFTRHIKIIHKFIIGWPPRSYFKVTTKVKIACGVSCLRQWWEVSRHCLVSRQSWDSIFTVSVLVLVLRVSVLVLVSVLGVTVLVLVLLLLSWIALQDQKIQCTRHTWCFMRMCYFHKLQFIDDVLTYSIKFAFVDFGHIH